MRVLARSKRCAMSLLLTLTLTIAAFGGRPGMPGLSVSALGWSATNPEWGEDADLLGFFEEGGDGLAASGTNPSHVGVRLSSPPHPAAVPSFHRHGDELVGLEADLLVCQDAEPPAARPVAELTPCPVRVAPYRPLAATMNR